MTDLKFDPGKHEYKWRGQIVPSVSRALNLIKDFSHVSKRDLEIATIWGTAIHRYLELYDQGRLDISKADPRMLPIIKTWTNICTEKKWGLTGAQEIEKPFYSQRYGYAGTPDRFFITDNSVVEFKSNIIPELQVRIQLAAYLQLISENIDITIKNSDRYVVIFFLDGKLKLKRFSRSTFKQDFSDFLCLLKTYQIRRRIHGESNSEV